MAHYGFGGVFPPVALIPHNNQGQLQMTRWPVEAVLLGRVDVLNERSSFRGDWRWLLPHQAFRRWVRKCEFFSSSIIFLFAA